MASWLTGYFIYFIAHPFLVAVVGPVVGYYGRRWWLGGLLGLAAGLAFMRGVGPFIVIAAVVWSLIGLGSGDSGYFIRMRRPRPAVLAGTWTVSALALLYLYSVVNRVHDESEFWFALVLIGVTTVLGGITAFALPMRSDSTS